MLISATLTKQLLVSLFRIAHITNCEYMLNRPAILLPVGITERGQTMIAYMSRWQSRCSMRLTGGDARHLAVVKQRSVEMKVVCAVRRHCSLSNDFVQPLVPTYINIHCTTDRTTRPPPFTRIRRVHCDACKA